MPKAKMPPGAGKDEYLKYKVLADNENENNDCVVRAISAATGASYLDVLRLSCQMGRKKGRGAQVVVTTQLAEAFGFKLEVESLESFNPPARRARGKHGKHGITSHHPDRFPQMWKDRGTLICWNRTHMWAVVDGVVIDWSRGRSLRVDSIRRVVKI